MGYRRSHHRRAHMRTNADGSKSYVKESNVKGHSYNKNAKKLYSSSHSDEYDIVENILFYVSLACFILFLLGIILRWTDALWFLLIFLISFFWLIRRKKRD